MAAWQVRVRHHNSVQLARQRIRKLKMDRVRTRPGRVQSSMPGNGALLVAGRFQFRSSKASPRASAPGDIKLEK